MATNLPYEGTKRPAWADPNKSDIIPSVGVYKGLVKKIDTGTRSGRLYVYIEEFSTNSATDPLGWALVDYASPFMGRTQGPAATGPYNNIQNSFNNTSQTYGFFMTPPDIGNIVLCCFPDGSRQAGYWFACVNTSLSKNMVPSIGGLPLSKIDPVSIPQDYVSFLRPGQLYPVGEFNENDQKVFVSNWSSSVLRPLHVPQFARLIQQGLDTDINGRGVVSSSMQRDPISSVFGFSTPGRPQPDPANDPSLQQKLSSGDFNPNEFSVKNRVGGHSLTMDDGDIYAKNNLVKLRTSAGHQILMNDTDGFMYIANSSGTAWIELTKEGDVLVYGQRDLSIRTRGNLMMHSDNLIQMNARGSIQMKSAGLQIENQKTVINSESSIQTYSNKVSLVGKNNLDVISQQVGISAIGDIKLDAPLVSINEKGGAPAAGSEQAVSKGPKKINQYRLPDTTFVQDSGWTIKENSLQSINYKIPTHEPYVRGSVADLVKEQEEIASQSLGASADRNVNGNPVSPLVSTGSTPGLDNAKNLGLDPQNAAPASAFISQPDLGEGVGNLNNTQLRAYMAQVGFNQSNAQYDIESATGLLGKYQLGVAALTELGYLKQGTEQTSEALNNPFNWTGLDGVFSATDFKTNGPTQEAAMFNFTKNNYAKLENLGLINQSTLSDEISGLLSASHVSSPDIVDKWVKTGDNTFSVTETVSNTTGTTTTGGGTTNRTADGTTTRQEPTNTRTVTKTLTVDTKTLESYYNQGRYSQTQLNIITASDNSKKIFS